MKKKKNQQKNPSQLNFIFAVMVTACVMLVCICGVISYIANEIGQSLISMDFGSSMCDPEHPTSIEGMARINLPPNYENLESMCGGMQGQYAEAKFDMPPYELDEFLQSTLFTREELTSTESPQKIESDYYDDLEMPDSFLYGIKTDGRDWLEEIIVDTTDPDRWTVYFTLLLG